MSWCMYNHPGKEIPGWLGAQNKLAEPNEATLLVFPSSETRRDIGQVKVIPQTVWETVSV